MKLDRLSGTNALFLICLVNCILIAYIFQTKSNDGKKRSCIRKSVQRRKLLILLSLLEPTGTSVIHISKKASTPPLAEMGVIDARDKFGSS